MSRFEFNELQKGSQNSNKNVHLLLLRNVTSKTTCGPTDRIQGIVTPLVWISLSLNFHTDDFMDLIPNELSHGLINLFKLFK